MGHVFTTFMSLPPAPSPLSVGSTAMRSAPGPAEPEDEDIHCSADDRPTPGGSIAL